MCMKKIPIGVSDFREIITDEYYYIDKTLFIKEVLDSGDKILLLPRPRRFGKTLNMSMLKYFFDCCPESGAPKTLPEDNPNKKLFDSLAISREAKHYLDEIGQYPVISLSFKDVKEEDWEFCFKNIKKLLQEEFLRHDYLLNGDLLKPAEKDYYKKIIDLTGDKSDYGDSLKKLLIFLNRFYNKQVVILIDEYDAPVYSGFMNGYYDEIISFMRNFLGGGLKDTDRYLKKSVITGIMRIAKESIFSGLNNPGVYTLLAEEFNQWFGFTEEEVSVMLDDFKVSHLLDQVQFWYNGYLFGGKVIYNPWSIINFLRSQAKRFKPYWVNTSDNKILDLLLSKEGKELKQELEQLIHREPIEKVIDENIILKDVAVREDLLWSFLLMGGYLKQTDERWDSGSGKFYYNLSIPNEEVKSTYTGIIDRYFTTKINNEKLEVMLKALIEGDITLFEEILQEVILAVFSYHDLSGEPEKIYHALVAGLLVWISNTHEVKSNRESGYGRYDIMIIPKDISRIGYIIEFKSVRKAISETVEIATQSALNQIESKKYETELIERGIKSFKKLAIVFSGKEVYVKEG